jgi:hypothetical protein
MFEHYRELENSLHEISKWVGRVVKVLATNGRPAPEAYVSAMRGICAVQEAWAFHLKIERVVFPKMLYCNVLNAEFLGRITKRNEGIENQLESILSAAWPRSAQAGLQSVQTGVSSILSQLIDQVECERAVLLPAILKMDHREPAAVRIEAEILELTAAWSEAVAAGALESTRVGV